MIRWFADLPIERKLRVVIMVPATVAFAIALTLHIATNLLHLRGDMLHRASRVARVIGPGVIAQVGAGDDQSANPRPNGHKILRSDTGDPRVNQRQMHSGRDRRQRARLPGRSAPAPARGGGPGRERRESWPVHRMASRRGRRPPPRPPSRARASPASSRPTLRSRSGSAGFVRCAPRCRERNPEGLGLVR